MNITIIRNTTQTLTFTATGDYSGDTIKFTVKADKTLTSSRLIDETASVSYSSPISTITVALTPSDSASLSNDTYYYDLRVENDSTDREVIESGIAYIDKSVRNDTDGAVVTESITIGSNVVEAIQDAVGIPLVIRCYNDTGTATIENGVTGLSAAFDSGIITFTHAFGSTNAVIKTLDDTYTYTISTENATTLAVTITDSEDALLEALDDNVNFLVNFNIASD